VLLSQLERGKSSGKWRLYLAEQNFVRSQNIATCALHTNLAESSFKLK